MVRAPCCEKMGLKRGPWTAEEDRTLINFVNEFGHGNWRALPKQAGLLRCGKSCRLRWVNYLDPSIKRGNFTREEEENIIKLHEMLGNRWSAIAARLPGRTDNEIKNVWHTHLKKRVDQSKNSSPKDHQPNKPYQKNKNKLALPKKEEEPTSSPSQLSPQSPQNSGGSEISSFTTATTTTSTSTSSAGGGQDNMVIDQGFPEMDENFWSEVFSGENSGDFVADPLTEFQFYSPLEQVENAFVHNSSNHDLNMDFWLNILTSDGELPEF